MEKHALKQADYIPVRHGSTLSYGGSQMWFSRQTGTGRERAIHGWGCGVVAACDLLLYLARRDDAAITPLNVKLAHAEEIDEADYLDYLKTFERHYSRVWEPFGIIGAGLAMALDRYFRIFRLPYRARWRTMLDNAKAQTRIEAMLDGDLPVILSLPPIYAERGALRLYSGAPTEEDDRGRVMKYRAFGGHFITVTALETDDAGRRTLTASSWGKQYRIDLADYERRTDTPAGLLASGMVEITPLAGPRRPAKITVCVRGKNTSIPAAEREKNGL